MSVAEIGDPRLQALFGANGLSELGVRPAVRLPRRGLSPIGFATVLLVSAILLFIVLNERRTRQSEPTVTRRPDSAASAWAAPPPLYIPPVEAPVTAPETEAPPKVAAPLPQSTPPSAPLAVAPVRSYVPLPEMAPPPPPPPRASSGSPLVIDSGGVPEARVAPAVSLPFGRAGEMVGRVRASAFANRSMTVPQGYLIPAVLETGFDSTKPGFARAIVSRDVRGFDGKNVLVPRGSRLIGEYRSDIGQGQSRAIITWTRLIRPDGMTIALDSPAADSQGGGGIPAHVNTHFFARLGDALLQTAVGVGTGLAQRSVTVPVVVVPGGAIGTATTAASPLPPSGSYVPTLTVPAGKSISVFVAHDLDFSAAGSAR